MTEIEIPVGPAPSSTDHPSVLPDEPGAVPVARTSSIIGTLHAEARAAADTAYKDMRIGKIPSLWARYRVLDSTETAELERGARQRRNLAQKVGKDASDNDEIAAARLLAAACADILWMTDDGDLIPLAEALAQDGVDVTGPLAYNAELAQLLQMQDVLDLGERPSSVDVVRALHRWGRASTPLTTTARVLSLWMSAVNADALEGVLEGK